MLFAAYYSFSDERPQTLVCLNFLPSFVMTYAQFLKETKLVSHILIKSGKAGIVDFQTNNIKVREAVASGIVRIVQN